MQHHFPFLELQANIQQSGPQRRSVAAGVPRPGNPDHVPARAPIWLAGLWYLLFQRAGKPFRALGWAWLVTAAVIMTMNPRIYYLFPAFPMLFAAGGVRWESWLAGPRLQWIKPVWAALMVLMGALLRSVRGSGAAARNLHPLFRRRSAFSSRKIETHKLGPLPQMFADQFGWEEMAAEVARVYNSLPPDVRAKTAIFGQNYGQAGAIDLFGPQYGLPHAISGHQNYFLWGPRDYTGESVIVMARPPADLNAQFAIVRKGRRMSSHPYSMPYEHFDVFYCRGLKWPLRDFWPKVKNWH